MKLTHFLTSAFFAAGILASPTFEQWVKWRESRGLSTEGFRPGTPLSPVDTTNTTFAADGNPVNTTSWAGAAYGAPPSGQTWELVSGVFTVPTVSGANAVVSIWNGIDGYIVNQIVIQGGIYITTDANGNPTLQSWSEWYPDAPIFYDQTTFPFATGDQLKIGIAVSAGATTADFIIENMTTNSSYNANMAPSNSANAAQGQTIEWVVERPAGTTLVNFGTVTFTDVVAQTNQAGFDLSNADTLSMSNSNTDPTIIAQGLITGTNSVQITYTGP